MLLKKAEWTGGIIDGLGQFQSMAIVVLQVHGPGLPGDTQTQGVLSIWGSFHSWVTSAPDCSA